MITLAFSFMSFGQEVSSVNSSERTFSEKITKSQNIKTGNNIAGFQAYPNPVRNGRLTIATSGLGEKEVTIFNVLGKQVFRQKFKGNKKLLDLSDINSGIYIMKVLEEEKNTVTKKLIIK